MGNVCKKKPFAEKTSQKAQGTSSSPSKIAPIMNASNFEAKDDESHQRPDRRDGPSTKKVTNNAEARSRLEGGRIEGDLLPLNQPREAAIASTDAVGRDAPATDSIKEDNNMSKQTTFQHSMKSAKREPTAENQTEPNTKRSDKYLKRYSIEQLEEDNKTITAPKFDVADSERNSEGVSPAFGRVSPTKTHKSTKSGISLKKKKFRYELKQMLDLINQARHAPASFISFLDKELEHTLENGSPRGNKSVEHRMNALLDAKNYLSNTKALDGLVLNAGLTAAAWTIANDQRAASRHSKIQPSMEHNLVQEVSKFGFFRSGILTKSHLLVSSKESHNCLLQLIINDNKPTLEDRINLFNPQASQVGFAFAKSKNADEPISLIIIYASDGFLCELERIPEQLMRDCGYLTYRSTQLDLQ